MLTIFNRRELTITFSKAEMGRICAILEESQIKYQLKVINRNRIVMPDIRDFNNDLNVEYIFYVHKLHLEKACMAISDLRRQ